MAVAVWTPGREKNDPGRECGNARERVNPSAIRRLGDDREETEISGYSTEDAFAGNERLSQADVEVNEEAEPGQQCDENHGKPAGKVGSIRGHVCSHRCRDNLLRPARYDAYRHPRNAAKQWPDGYWRPALACRAIPRA
jgi:hypothetical protein